MFFKILPKKFDKTRMTVWFVILLFESAFVQLLQAKRANKMFWMELSEHCCYTATCNKKKYTYIRILIDGKVCGAKIKDPSSCTKKFLVKFDVNYCKPTADEFF